MATEVSRHLFHLNSCSPPSSLKTLPVSDVSYLFVCFSLLQFLKYQIIVLLAVLS